MPLPEIGSPAPDFSGVTQDGSTLTLSDFRGKRLALYFYPRDHTPGCTKQACNLRDYFGELEKAGIAVVGVSDDPVERHGSFAEKHGLPFPLIADTGRKILEAYGVWGEKKLYGRSFFGAKRMTFLIDGDGTLVDIIRKPKVGEHAAEIQRRFEVEAAT
jgi:peroxiredoxin Q/BCP